MPRSENTTSSSVSTGPENWQRENLAWLAGLLEGEGCFLLTFKKNKNGTGYPCFCVSMNMNDEDVVMRAANIVGFGNYSGPWLQYNPKHKPFYRWSVVKRDYVYALLVAIYPFMGSRRKAKIETILRTYREYEQRRWKHGTRQGYEGHGCRCAECCLANTKRHRLRRGSEPRNMLTYTVAGQTLSSTEWERRTGISRSVLRARRLRGWSDEAAVNTPVRYKQILIQDKP